MLSGKEGSIQMKASFHKPDKYYDDFVSVINQFANTYKLTNALSESISELDSIYKKYSEAFNNANNANMSGFSGERNKNNEEYINYVTAINNEKRLRKEYIRQVKGIVTKIQSEVNKLRKTKSK
jgi:hypothetical protein